MGQKTPKKLSNTMIEIRDYMDQMGGITQLDASIDLGVGRLASRISEMRLLGVPIEVETVKVLKRNGKTAHVSRYKIAKEEAEPEQKV